MAQDNQGNGSEASGKQASPGRFGSGSESPSLAFANLVEEIARVRLEVKTIITTRVDLVRARLRRLVFWVAIGAAAGVCVLVLLVVSIAQLSEGAAGGLGELFGGRLWIGRMATGALVLGTAITAVWVFRRRWLKTRASILQKYARFPAASQRATEAPIDAR